MNIKINEVMSGKKIALKPKEPGKIGIYVCGVTVYDRCHIGHLRSFLSFDAIVRYLEYVGNDVTYVRNYTDIDDKIINRSMEMKQGLDGEWKNSSRYETFTENDWALRKRDDEAILKAGNSKHLALDVSKYFIKQFEEDFDPYNLRTPDVEPKVSTHMAEIISLIENIIKNGYGYAVDGDVYFDVEAYHRDTRNYGKLSRRDYQQLMEGARVDPQSGKKNGVDFALWKSTKEGEPAWDSPWGKGRPGWHIECSAMSTKYLGMGFDIHGGGKDLIFPHHENEIAQSEAGFGHQFVRNWMHNGFVTVDGVKMSKSLGNFLSLDDAAKLALPEVWRFLVLSVHYSSPIDFSRTRKNESGEIVRGSVDIASERIQYFYNTILRAENILEGFKYNNDLSVINDDFTGTLISRFEEAMNDDFNTAIAISHIGETAKSINEITSMKAKKIKKTGREVWLNTIACLKEEMVKAGGVLGILQENPSDFLSKLKNLAIKKRGVTTQFIENKIKERSEAKLARDFAKSDAIRDELEAQNIVIMDTPHGTQWDVKF